MAEPPAQRADRSMSLLVDMMTDSLDPAYGAVAATRAAERAQGTSSPRPARRTAVLSAVLVVAGLITGTAAAQVRRDARQVDQARASLVGDVREQTTETDALARTADQARADVAEVRAAALGQDAAGRAAAAQLAALELATGAVAVRGPGLVVQLDDAPDAGQQDGGTRGGQLGDGRIYDRDVQDVVNALWLAGAEAISVNGQRITAQTAIRSAGEAVLVDFRPLTPPYVVRAVGDVDAMEPAFADTTTARQFQTWTSLYGLRFSLERAGSLRLAAASVQALRSVERTP